MQAESYDADLLHRFQQEVVSRVPHRDEKHGGIANPTPLVELTSVLQEYAIQEFGIDLGRSEARVFGKFDSRIAGGSVKVRPAVQIVTEAISSGKLTSEKTVFEATSGNFGIALALLGKMGLRVVGLVSRKLQPGVLEALKSEGVALVNLDIDICPAPGLQGDADLLLARGIAVSVRQQLKDAGLDLSAFDGVRTEAEGLLARQDVIGLAKLLARAYDGFCPEQYDNDLNVRAHQDVTGPEISQQLEAVGLSLSDFDVVCAFGTGGSATGLSRYAQTTCRRKAVNVVYPLPSQDVAGIRTRDKAVGLKFYRPGEYSSEKEVDFERAKRLFAYLNGRGYDVGESGALVLYGGLELISQGRSSRVLALIADGSSKYMTTSVPPDVVSAEVTLTEAASRAHDYDAVVWTHGAFVPKDAGIAAIASSLGMEPGAVRVAKAREVQALVSGGEVAEVFIPSEGSRRLLLVCMVGGTSMMAARALASKGIAADSLSGGIVNTPAVRGKRPLEYLRPATE